MHVWHISYSMWKKSWCECQAVARPLPGLLQPLVEGVGVLRKLLAQLVIFLLPPLLLLQLQLSFLHTYLQWQKQTQQSKQHWKLFSLKYKYDKITGWAYSNKTAALFQLLIPITSILKTALLCVTDTCVGCNMSRYGGAESVIRTSMGRRLVSPTGQLFLATVRIWVYRRDFMVHSSAPCNL